jgi:hypothetical protein
VRGGSAWQTANQGPSYFVQECILDQLLNGNVAGVSTHNLSDNTPTVGRITRHTSREESPFTEEMLHCLGIRQLITGREPADCTHWPGKENLMGNIPLSFFYMFAQRQNSQNLHTRNQCRATTSQPWGIIPTRGNTPAYNQPTVDPSISIMTGEVRFLQYRQSITFGPKISSPVSAPLRSPAGTKLPAVTPCQLSGSFSLAAQDFSLLLSHTEGRYIDDT